MGFHCGNTSSACLIGGGLKYQLIMHRLMEPGKEPDITRGTLEGRIKVGDITIFRLQSTADTILRSYVAQGEVLDIDPKSFGGIGVFAIKEMGRFYRHVLIEKRFPHHTAVAFAHAGQDALRRGPDARRRGHRLQPARRASPIRPKIRSKQMGSRHHFPLFRPNSLSSIKAPRKKWKV